VIKIIFFARFKKVDMERLCQALDLPEKCTCYQGTTATGMEGLMILLRRFSYPNRWRDLVPFFGRAEEELSVIFSKVKHSCYCIILKKYYLALMVIPLNFLCYISYRF
jgi:hypothetical protein